MASSDWTVLNESLGLADCQRGTTAGIVRPAGGGDFVYGFNSQKLVSGAVALHANQNGYAPLVSGGSIRGAVQRGVSGGDSGFAPFLFIGLQGQSVADPAYVLGLSDDDPHHIVLRKGALTDGVPDVGVDPDGAAHVLLRSTNAYTPGTWLHLRLDMIVQGSGDVLLQVYQNDLAQHPVSTPVWAVVPGMEGPSHPTFTGFIDDSLGVQTGSAPYTGGRVGFGFQVVDTARRGFFDHIQVGRQ